MEPLNPSFDYLATLTLSEASEQFAIWRKEVSDLKQRGGASKEELDLALERAEASSLYLKFLRDTVLPAQVLQKPLRFVLYWFLSLGILFCDRWYAP